VSIMSSRTVICRPAALTAIVSPSTSRAIRAAVGAGG
jgi:hypothetical protein